MLIDTHCHLDFERFDEDRSDVILRAKKAGVAQIIVPAIDLQNCSQVLSLTVQHSGVFAAVGIHPNSSAAWTANWLDEIRDFATHSKVVAIGEIGLDYYWDDSPKEIQHAAFVSQLGLADALNLPVIVHSRDAGEDVIRLLGESPIAGKDQPGVLHSFSDTLQIAQAALEMGFYIGITGPVTFRKADDLRQVVAKIPLDRIVLETDAPFLAPQQRRGKRNEPAFVSFVAEQIAASHGIGIEEVAAITTRNALRLFGRLGEIQGAADV